MSEPTQEDVNSIVSSYFEIGNRNFTLDTLTFEILNHDFKSRFVQLAQNLEQRDLFCHLEKTPQGVFVLVRRYPPRKKRRWLSSTWTPRILFGVVIFWVMMDGFFRTNQLNTLTEFGDPLQVAAIYTLSLLGILGVHEAGHLIVAKLHRLKTSWPYFLPGIPFLPIFGWPSTVIPTFGAVISSRSLTVNRHILFDVAIAGPIAGLIIAILVSIFAAYTAPVIDMEQYEELFEEGRVTQWSLGEPLIMSWSLDLFGKNGDQEVIMTPYLYAAWIGFLITFLNLLPAWQLDGGHMARAMFGSKWHRVATYASIGVLVWPLGYWFMAMFILLLMSRSPGVTPLDDVSPLPNSRKLMYAIVVVFAFLCAPLPEGALI